MNLPQHSYLLASASSSGIHLWKLETQQLYKSFRPHTKQINTLQWNRNNQVLVSGSDDGTIALCHSTGKVLGTLPLDYQSRNEEIKSLYFSSGSRYLCSGGTSGIVKLWDLKQRTISLNCKGHNSTIYSVSFSSNDQHIASGSGSGDLMIHSIAQNRAVSVMKRQRSQAIRSLQYSIFKPHLISTGYDDGSVVVWDVTREKEFAEFKGIHLAPCIGVRFSPVNHLLLSSAGLDKKLNFYDVMEKKLIKVITTDIPLESLAFKEDGRTVATGTSDGRIFIFDLRKDSKPVHIFNLDTGHAVTSLSFQAYAKPVRGRSSARYSMPVNSRRTIETKSKIEIPRSASKLDHPNKENEHVKQPSAVKQKPTHVDDMDVFSPVKQVKPFPDFDIPKYSNDFKRAFSGNFEFLRSAKPTAKEPIQFKPSKEDSAIFSPVDKDVKETKVELPLKSDTFKTDTFKSFQFESKTQFSTIEPFKSDLFKMDILSPVDKTVKKTDEEPVDRKLEFSPAPAFEIEKPAEKQETFKFTTSPSPKKYSLTANNRYKSPVEQKPAELTEKTEQKQPSFAHEANPFASTTFQQPAEKPVSEPFKFSQPILQKTDITKENELINDIKPIHLTEPPKKTPESSQINIQKPSDFPTQTFDSKPTIQPTSEPKAQPAIQQPTDSDKAWIMESLKSALDDKLNTMRSAIHEDIRNMHLDMLKQFHLQEEAIENIIASSIQPLIEQIKELREENKRLKSQMQY